MDRCSPRSSLLYAAIASLALVALSDFRRFPNVDEIAHLPAGVSHWKFEQFDLYRVNPPLIRMVAALPAVLIYSPEYDWSEYRQDVGSRPEFNVGLSLFRESGLQIRDYYVLPRICCVSFFFVGVYFLHRVTSLLLGCLAANVIVVLWSIEPSVLATATSICPDLGATAMGVVASYAFWKYLQSPSNEMSIIAGVGLGLAMLTKLTWLTATITLPLATFSCIVWLGKSLPDRTWQRRFQDLLLAWATSLLVLNAGYLFEGTCIPLGEFEFCSETLGGEGSTVTEHGNRFTESWLATVPVPLPRNYVLGIDYLKMEVEHKRWSFLNGEWRFGSWPHYYLFTTLYKTSEATLLASALGFVIFTVGVWRKLVSPKLFSMVILLALPAAVCFLSVSLQGGFNHHHRYVLMVYPPMLLFASISVSPLSRQVFSTATMAKVPKASDQPTTVVAPMKARSSVQRRWNWFQILAIVLVIMSAISALKVRPYFTSYFNTLCGGPENGWHLLGFSNIDWGQDLLEVENWIREHPECRPLSFELNYFNANGEVFGLPRQ